MLRAIAIFIIAIAGMAAFVWACSTLVDRRLSNGEIVLAGVSIAGIYWCVTAVRRHHARKQRDSIRDSALW